MSFDDELLLTTLGGALETRPEQPSATELAEFRALVTGAGLGDVLPFPQAVDRRHRRRSVVLAAAVVVALVVLGAGVLASRQPLPNSLRSPARALGLPVDDTAVAETRTAMASLRAALEGTDDARIEAAAVALAARLRSLSGDDLASVAGEARALLRVADARLSRGGLGILGGDPVTPTTAATAPAGDSGDAASSDDGQVGSGGGTVEAPEAEPADDAAEESSDELSEEPSDDSLDDSSDDATPT